VKGTPREGGPAGPRVFSYSSKCPWMRSAATPPPEFRLLGSGQLRGQFIRICTERPWILSLLTNHFFRLRLVFGVGNCGVIEGKKPPSYAGKATDFFGWGGDGIHIFRGRCAKSCTGLSISRQPGWDYLLRQGGVEFGRDLVNLGGEGARVGGLPCNQRIRLGGEHGRRNNDPVQGKGTGCGVSQAGEFFT